MMLTTCPECGGAVTRATDTFDVHIGRRTVAVRGEYERCQGECREFYFAPGEMDSLMVRASSTIRAQDGLLLPSEIKALRHRSGLTQTQLEELLGAGAKTVVRWEKGTVIQNGATDTLLRVLRDVPESLQYLLNERGIIPKVVPLIPKVRTIAYHYEATMAPTSSPITALSVVASESSDLNVVMPFERAELIA